MPNKMKNMRALLLMLLAMVTLSVSAQNVNLVGTIVDSTGEPIIGASIMEKGTSNNGTITDLDGNFSLKVASNATVIISYIGMKSQEISVNGKSRIDVTLQDDATALDEVVVIGYGTAKRKDLTGSVASVGSEAIAAVPVSSAAEAITGKLAGVQISTTEGSPDAEIKIRVRGGGSITGDNSPLFVVDGFPVESIGDIAPSDIESIDVLKDASSTAIYGSRGANGVIIVTTKSGKEGKVNVNYNAYVGWKKMAKQLDVLDSYDYASWQYERAMLRSKLEEYTKFFGNYQDMDMYKEVGSNDWQEQTFGRTGFSFNHNLSITGGTDKLKYAFSYSRTDEKAIMQMSDFKRENLSLKLNSKPNKAVTIDFSVRYSDTEINGGGANEQNEISSADSRLKYAMIYTPFPVSGLTDSDETDDEFNLHHPLVALKDNDQYQERKRITLNGGATWEIIKGLRLRSEVSLDDYRKNDDRYYGTTTYYVKNVPATENKELPAVIFTKRDRTSFRNTNTVNYDFKNLIPSDFTLNVLAGQEYIVTKEQALTSAVHGFPSSFTFSQTQKLSAQGNPYSTDNFFSPDDILLSFFGRANFDYLSKYIFSATFRADGSSKFSEGNRWGYFPSAALAWRISSESFMENTKTWLDDLKLRVSYGTAGNNNIPSGQMAQTYGVSSTAWVSGFGSYWSPSKVMANPDLKWETTVTRNIGLDFTTFGGRFSGTLEGYINNTEDLLIGYTTTGTGYDSQYRNMGETQNSGFEATLNWVAINKKNFGLSLSGNIGFNKNKIKSLGQMNYITGESGWASSEIGIDYKITENGSIGQMYGYRSDGRYEVSDFESYDPVSNTWNLKEGVVDSKAVVGTIRPGSMKLKDLDGDGFVTRDDKDKEVIGDSNPLHTGGFTINARVYGFDLTANFNWNYGNDVYNANKIEYTSTSKYHSRNMLSEMASGKRWTNLLPDGTICNDAEQLAAMNATTTMWSPLMDRFVFSDWAVEDGSFLRLNTLTLGYTLPASLVRKAKIQNCRFYVTGYNVFCLTNYSGFDPDVSTRRKTALTPGVDYSAYPKSRSIVFGVNLNF
ncbi:TonB-dependent receptor [Bacteroides sp. 519]|uniref:SusC/RagA family TonB-linked outer membrane protein n=1 Tax=Bacteroides sp. 519 TaxID=2302937 RepID=UPI0013D88A88|nr:TonB-dependent receptor [Bacteroides sp. 519]NDV57183.1 TonB-dependent receptor [Bacteroides sp. 519]